jgi:hypothetical protein
MQYFCRGILPERRGTRGKPADAPHFLQPTEARNHKLSRLQCELLSTTLPATLTGT